MAADSVFWIIGLLVVFTLGLLWIAHDDSAAPEPSQWRAKSDRARVDRRIDKRLAVLTRDERRKIAELLERLRGQDGADLAPLVAALGDVRDEMMIYGVDLRDPLMAVSTVPDALRRVCVAMLLREDQGQQIHAACAGVWFYTLRAIQEPLLRQPLRDIWAQVARGYPHLLRGEATARAVGLSGVSLVDICEPPRGFDPQPRD